MGNGNSNANSDTEEDEHEEEAQCKEKESGGDVEGNLDLNILFNPQWLRDTACKIKEDACESPLQQHHGTLQRWLEDRKSRGEETVTISQFTDFFANRGVDKEVANEMFHQFDIEGDGVIDVELFHEILAGGCVNNVIAFRNDLQSVNKLMKDCILTPGFVDAFTDEKTKVENHGHRLSQFLGRNRAPCQALALPALDGFLNTTEMRLKVLQAHLNVLKEKADNKKKEPPVQADEILKPITRCFTSVEVSTNRNDANKLIDGDPKTFWQSEGPARSHWIRLRIPPNVVIKQLSINVAASDQSYMPQHVVVSGGRDPNNLRELNETRIPSHFTGDHILLENLKTPFPVIQIAIKRCHSDGCDTRVRQVKAVGYRVVKSRGVSIFDATAMWYLSVLASTAEAALPVAPTLRDAIINHTRMALQHIQPLTLSSASAERPGFLSHNVLEQMEQFLQSIVCLGDTVSSADIAVLLEFVLARGSLGSIFGILKLLYEKRLQEYEVVQMLRCLHDVQEKAVRKHGAKLHVSLVNCDGGAKDDSSGPQNVLTDNWQEGYFTAQGKKKVAMTFSLKSEHKLQLTRVFIKVAKGAIGADCGLIFVFDLKEHGKDDKDGQITDILQTYETWTGKDYKELMTRIKEGHEPEDHDPVAFFQLDREWDDVDVPVDRIKIGNCVVVLFLQPRQESAERICILGVNFYGYEWNQELTDQRRKLEKELSLPKDENRIISGDVLLLHVLRFLEVMAWDTTRLKSSKEQGYGDKDPSLDLQDVIIKDIWDLYKLVKDRIHEDVTCFLSSVMILSIFHLALPYLKPGLLKLRESKKGGKSCDDKEVQEKASCLSEDVLQHFYNLVDDPKTPKTLHTIARNIILDGAEVFFPDASTRREHLLSLIDQVMEDERAVSLAYTFESLCKFFSNRDASGLLGLPELLPKASFNMEPVIHVMKTLVSVACRECRSQIKGGACPEAASSIVQLLCSMQKSLLSWCHSYCTSGDKEVNSLSTSLLTQYVELMASLSTSVLQSVNMAENKMKVIDSLEYSFLSLAMRQLILFLNLFASLDIPVVSYLRFLHPLADEIRSISLGAPDLFYQPDSTDRKSKEDNITLRTWEVESPHNYEHNAQEKMVFICPGCTSFRVEFDPRCETERRYDYLEFTDSKGNTRRFDQKVGTDKWPLVVYFPAGHKLHFVFHSDGSNNEWGYKFKAFAVGRPDIAVSWIFDLQLNLARLFGTLCSNALDCRRALDLQSNQKDTLEERALLHSELWSSLFRGGYMVGKLERSLSGFHGANPSDSVINSYLCAIATGEGDRGKNLLEKCRTSSSSLAVGGPLVDAAVNAVFAALVWHTQELREQIASFALDDSVPDTLPVGVLHAYNVAENVRRTLLESRQKLLVEAEETKDSTREGGKLQNNPDWPVISCQQKALFLLKFAGLSKLPRRTKEIVQNVERKSSFLNRRSWHRQDSHEPRRQSRHVVESHNHFDKYPTFRMVTEFVTNESLSHERIHALLQQRCKYANTVASIYSFASDVLGNLSRPEIFQTPAVLFLQQLLLHQQHFPRHYANYLNGCGLELENKVRRAFYSLIRKLAEGVMQTMQKSTSKCSLILECARAYLLHLLDVEWKPYDNAFIEEISLPELLLQTSKSTAMHQTGNSDELELEMYEQHLKFFKEAKDMTIGEWCDKNRNNSPKDVQRNMSLFIARFSDQLDVTISCDGCATELRGRRYRCLNCVDMDLCGTCYTSGVKPEGHTDQHEVIDLRFKCDNCNAFIVGTRIHCNECKDFDLCLGCFKAEEFPVCHKATHGITRFHMSLDLGTSRPSGVLQSYIHYHSWLQFAALALCLSESVQEKRNSGLDVEYARTASNILLICLEKAVNVLSVTSALQGESKPPQKEARVATSKETENVSGQPTDTDLPDRGDSGAIVESRTECDETDSSVSTVNTSQRSSRDQSENTPEVVVVTSVQDDTTLSPPFANTEEQSHTSNIVLDSVFVVPPSGGLSSFQGLDSDTLSTFHDMPLLEEVESPRRASGQQQSNAKARTASTSYLSTADEVFAVMAQNRVLGLLASLLPTNRQLLSHPEPQQLLDFISLKLIPTLDKLVRWKDGNQKIRIQALGALAKALKCLPPKVADEGLQRAAPEEIRLANRGALIDGSVTVHRLFKLGAGFLERADLVTASGVEVVLKQLSCARSWQDVVTKHATECLQKLADDSRNPSLTSLFALMVFAGFPDVYRTGMLANISDANGESRKAVVLEYFQEKGNAVVCSMRTRKKIVVKEHQIENFWSWSDGVDSNRISVLLTIIKDILPARRVPTTSVERKWGLALALKALLGNLKAGIATEEVQEIINSGVVPLFIHLACQGTGFSKQWLLRDLEILSWKLYGIDKEKEAAGPETSSKTPVAKDSSENKSAPKAEHNGPLDGLDEDTRQCFQTIHDALRCEYSVIRAIFESVGRDRDKLLEEVQRSFDEEEFKISDEVKELARKWVNEGAGETSKESTNDDTSLDMGVLRFAPQPIEHKDLQAKPESGESPLKLISSMTEAEISETRTQQRKNKSTELLRAELETRQKTSSKDFIRKVNHAVAVGYARRLVAWLFSMWPEGQAVSQAMLSNIDACKIVGLLDLIQSIESSDVFEKVVFNFVRSCDKSLVQPLALSAVHCMGDVRLASEIRESEHKYKDNTKMEGKVHIPGASSLFIRFDERCSTEHSCDELVLSSSPDLQLNQRVFSGQAEWQDFEVPGDTVYFKFTSDSSNTDWGWRFTVTGGQLGRFETACSILNSLLGQDMQFARSLPLQQLWSWLIVVACNQTGQQRLMATGLLLRILQIASGDPSLFHVSQEPLPAELRPNLTLLRPLWSLYTKSIETDPGTSLALVSPVIRGLSEFFLVVENVAQDWNVAKDLIAGLATDEKLRQCFNKVVGNIAAIAIAANIPCSAVDILANTPRQSDTTQETLVTTEVSRQSRTRINLRISGDCSSDSSSSILTSLLLGNQELNGTISGMNIDGFDDEGESDDEDDEDEDGNYTSSTTSSEMSTPEPPSFP